MSELFKVGECVVVPEFNGRKTVKRRGLISAVSVVYTVTLTDGKHVKYDSLDDIARAMPTDYAEEKDLYDLMKKAIEAYNNFISIH
jgi:hypothetical protein